MIDNQIMSAVLDVGEAMLTSGGEVSRIEQMMTPGFMVEDFTVIQLDLINHAIPAMRIRTASRNMPDLPKWIFIKKMNIQIFSVQT